MLPRSFYFLRHGETDWNKAGRIQGHTDIPLNDTGRSQARNVIDTLAAQPIDKIVTSPLARAHETAMIINEVLKKPFLVDEDLKERHFGILEGAPPGEMDQMQKDMLAQGLTPEENGYPCPEGAEPYDAFRERITGSLLRHLEQNPGENLLFVSHGGAYRVLHRCLFNSAHMSGNVQPFYFEKRDKDWLLSSLR